jgi:hypothetical protein
MPERDATPAETRRDFMRASLRRLAQMSARAIGGRGWTGSTPKPPATKPPPPPPATTEEAPLWLNRKPESMIYARLGRTGFMASRLALDGSTFGSFDPSVVRRAVDRGVNLLLVSLARGRGDIELGRLLPELRDRVWIAGRTAPMDGSEGGAEIDPAAAFEEDLHAELARVGVDAFDIFFFDAPRDADAVRDAELHAAIERARERGLIRRAGLSARRDLQSTLYAALQVEGVFDVLLAPVGPLNLAEMGPLLDRARRRDVGFIATDCAAGLAMANPGAPIPLGELPAGMDAEQLGFLHALRRAPVAACLIRPESPMGLDRMMELATIDPTPFIDNELDSIVEDELWPVCGACGERGPIATADLEAAFDAMGRDPRRGGVGAIADRFSRCERCRRAEASAP